MILRGGSPKEALLISTRIETTVSLVDQALMKQTDRANEEHVMKNGKSFFFFHKVLREKETVFSPTSHILLNSKQK